MLEPWIAPSILSADFARLGEEVRAVLEAGADLVHFDVMDNHYVPNLTIGPLVCAALRKAGITAPIDVHLMVQAGRSHRAGLREGGGHLDQFHPEAAEHVDRTIGLIREQGCRPGLVLNPATPLNWLDHVLDKIDLVLLMSVNPGFGGQSFIPGACPRSRRSASSSIAAAGKSASRSTAASRSTTSREIAAAGADTFVAGSAIFGTADYRATIAAMRPRSRRRGQITQRLDVEPAN